jgi:hypothetical protein
VIIDRGGREAEHFLLIVEGCVAIAIDAVDPDSPLLVETIAASDIEMRGGLPVRQKSGRQRGEGFVVGFLGNEIDGERTDGLFSSTAPMVVAC